jgi:Tol biopolymer transport system component
VLFAVHPRTDRVSVDTNGNSVAGATNTEPSISRTGGRFIAFTSTGSTLIAGVVGQQIYVHDRQTGQPSLASKSSLGSAGIGGVSSAASVSADGRFIAFASTATNLVAGVSGQQIYLYDTQTSVVFPNGQTTLVSKDNNGVASNGSITTNPAISADGRFITYEANATTLVPGVSGQQIYLHDTRTSVAFPNGQTTLVSKNNSGTAGDGLSKMPTISNDGRFIAFASASSNLVTGISGAQIYRHDTQISLAFPNGQTLPVSIDDSGVAGVGLSTAPVIIDDGSVAAFVSTAPLVPGAAAASDIYVRALP